LRVDSACTEKSRMEMQNLMNNTSSSSMNSPYGDSVGEIYKLLRSKQDVLSVLNSDFVY
jgi:hypothetical protein